MPDTLLTASDYADIREATASVLTDSVLIEARTKTNTSQGVSYVYSTRATVAGLLVELGLQPRELERAQQLSSEASVEVRLPALTTVAVSDRLTVTHHQTGLTRRLEIVYVPSPSREFVRRVLCKQL